MPDKAQDDDLVITLVELALALPPAEREAYLRNACSGEEGLFAKVWNYVEWEHRMNGFLLDPLYSAASERPFEPGDRLLGRFRIVREVAEGGMGIVYEAVDEKLDRRIALKCAKPGFRKQLPPEVRHATEISHPNVCKIFEIHSTPSRTGEIDFLTMEFLDGETLSDRLRRGPIPEQEARSIAAQLCAGLAEAHRKRVVHGDLKSGNIILARGPDGTPRAVITDFGLASGPDGRRALHSSPVGGTPDYMAPELWKGEKASIASDIYALGVILCELASGRRPESASMLLAAGENGSQRREIPKTYPRWDRVVARCLDPDPASRFRDAAEVALALAPSQTLRTMLAAVAVAILTVGSAALTYVYTAVPPSQLSLAVLPLQAESNSRGISRDLARDAAKRAATLHGGRSARFRVVPWDRIERDKVDSLDKARAIHATHALHGSFLKDRDKFVLHVYLTDVRSQVQAREWTIEYAPGQLRYAPAALAGFVSQALGLSAEPVTVNPAALPHYLNGISLLRRDTGVDGALGAFEAAVIADPDSPLPYAGLAEAQWFKYFLTRDRQWLDRSTESLRQAEGRNPDLAPVHRVAGMLRVEGGMYELATAEYRRAIELEPGASENYRRLALVSELNNQPDEALAAYRKGLQVQPDDARLHLNLGALVYRKADYDEAIRHLRLAVDLAPDDPNAHRALAAAYLNQGRFADAEAELRACLALHELPAALNSLGLALMYQSRNAEAIPYFRRAVELDPGRQLTWLDLGVVYQLMRQAAEAEKAFRRGLELAEIEMTRNPRNGYLRSQLAYLCARLGDRRRAESEIAQALQLSPNEADARWMAILTYEVLGNRESALGILGASPPELIKDVNRWPEVADLQRDSRFRQLLGNLNVK